MPPRASLSNTNSALELRVVDAEGMDQPFTVSQNGTLRTYTGAYDTATLTGDLNTLRYLQDHGAQTIQFVTNGQTSSFAINDLLAQGSGSEVFYLTHRGAEEPTLLLVEADRQRTGERLTIPGGGVYRKAPLASLLQKPPARSASCRGLCVALSVSLRSPAPPEGEPLAGRSTSY